MHASESLLGKKHLRNEVDGVSRILSRRSCAPKKFAQVLSTKAIKLSTKRGRARNGAMGQVVCGEAQAGLSCFSCWCWQADTDREERVAMAAADEHMLARQDPATSVLFSGTVVEFSR